VNSPPVSLSLSLLSLSLSLSLSLARRDTGPSVVNCADIIDLSTTEQPQFKY